MQANPSKGSLLARVAARHLPAVAALALHLAPTAHGFGGFAFLLLGRLFVVLADFHLAEHAFALKFLFKCAQRLFDVVVAD